ncbi:hypothetical protein ACPC54_23550 [Kitasatospora sp. NPDC094028]
MNALQVLALVSPIVLLATLTARAASWKTKLSDRIDELEKRVDQHQDDLHELGTAVRKRND